jgi:response regulator RpfG family c-di-GMP phosphodiesterase
MRKLLLIVDDWESLEWYEKQLGSLYDLIGAPFGSEGIRLAKELRPDQILLDLVFEDMTPREGFALLQEHSETKLIPTLIIMDVEVEAGFRWPTGTSSLNRPYKIEDLIKSLSNQTGKG